MKQLDVLVALVVLVAVAASSALGQNSRRDETVACAKGAVAVRVGGKRVCLRVGTICKAKYNSIYKRHGFTCVAGHLRKSTQPKPPAPTPEPPYTPPTGPVGTANTTVTVEMFDETDTIFVLSQTTIPSGMVTFVITSRCLMACSFDLEGVKAGRTLNRGESETWTVGLAPGVYRYHCDVFPEGMKGTFAVTP